MTFKQFMLHRLIRLSPLYYAGLITGFLAMIFAINYKGTAATSDAIRALAIASFWLPYSNSLEWPAGAGTSVGPAFPLNGPAWSLFYELVVNILFFAWVRLRCARFTPLLALASMCFYLFSIVRLVLGTRAGAVGR